MAAISRALVNNIELLIQARRRSGLSPADIERHLSPAALEIARQYHLLPNDEPTAVTPPLSSPSSETEPKTAVFDLNEKTAIYPVVAVAFLSNDLVSVGRLFHLLKHYDAKHGGGGYLAVSTIYGLAEELGIGKRRLRMILAEGDGRAWDRYKSGRHVYLRLFSPEAVCRALGANYSRRRVYLPVGAFFEAERRGEQVTAVKHTAAHFYSCIFHLTGKSGVISRETLAALTGVSDETQRHYEYLLGIESKRNYRPTEEPAEPEPAYEYGGRRNLSIFVYHDFTHRARRRNPAGERRLTVSLPNSYERPFEIASKGRRYRHNLASKCRRGTRPDTVFFLDEMQAAKKANRQPGHDVLYRGDTIRGAVLWPCAYSLS